MKRLALVLVALTWLTGACSDEAQKSGPAYETSLAALVAVDGCGEVLDLLKEKLIAEMEERIDQQVQSILDGEGCYWAYEDGVAMRAGGVDYNSAPSQAAEEGASEYSTTNNQVAGVDEADFLKNDGSFIYLVADGRFQVLDAWPPEEATRITEMAIDGTPKKLFVHDGRAVIYSSLGALDSGNQYDGFGGYYYGGDQECTYGYDCDFTGDGQKLQVTVLDLQDLLNPQVVRKVVFNGSYLNSRRINDIVYTVAVFPELSVPGLVYWPEDMGNYWDLCWQGDFDLAETLGILSKFDQLKKENRQKILAADITDFLPSIVDTRFVDGQEVTEAGLLDGCDDFYLSQTGDGKTLLSTVSFDMSDVGPLAATTVVGRPGAVYANADSLYIASRHYGNQMYGWFWDDGSDEATTVHKFTLASGQQGTSYAGSGVVKGRILNQFAMDEHEGFLRIATTTGHVPNPEVHSTISILEERDGALETVGMVDDIAPTEDIRSVRFAGDRGFVVTFKKTDPLFVFDLSNPDAPTILAELKIPGFSTYMHMMDDDHLLTIGYDADDKGSFAYFQGIMLQIFDVSDPTDPKLTHKEVIGTRGSTSDAATNHLAFNYFPNKDLLAIPMTICEGGSGGGGSYGDLMTFSGLLVYHVTAEGGFTLQGGIPHSLPETEETYWGACSNWWTQANSVVKRSIFMDDFVYSIALDLVQVASLEALATPIASISLLD
jgi:hypothetical protein